MAYLTPQYPNCENCNKNGLAILPVRYAVVPTIAKVELPPFLGNKVTSVVLKHHKYALRTLRKGYFYLYYEKHARGTHIKWEVYSVTEGGVLIKQDSINSIKEATDVICSRKEHLIPASVITIDTPEKCGRVWMAFSEHMWGEKTFEQFQQDVSLRDRRMQTFSPSDWVVQRTHPHGILVTEENLNHIIEYKRNFALSALGGTDIGTISSQDGTFDRNRLERCSTMHPVTVRRDVTSKLIQMMKKAGEKTAGPSHEPVILALWDCVGITHELNGFRNDALGWVKKYNEERELESDAAAAIEGAKLALAEQAETLSRVNFSVDTFKWDATATRDRLRMFDTIHSGDPAARSREIDLCRRWEKDAAQQVPMHVARQRVKFKGLTEPAWQAQMIEIDIAAGPVPDRANMAARDALHAHDQSVQNLKNEKIAHSWDKYEPHINRTALDIFLSQRKTLCVRATMLADSRTDDVVEWLTAKALQDALLEFNDTSVNDGEAFTHTIANLIFGIRSSRAGEKLLKKWVNSAALTEANLLWRCFSLNQKEGTTHLDNVLTAIQFYKETPLTKTGLDKSTQVAKHLAKLGQLSQKGLALHNALRTDRVAPIPTGGIEKILISVGNLFLQPFIRKTVDTLSEGLILALLLTRAGSHHIKIMDLLICHANANASGRAETLMTLKMGYGVVSNRFKAQRSAWDLLAKDADVPKLNKDSALAGGFNESKQLAVGMIATIFQGAYVWKLYAELEEEPGNEKLKSELWIAGFALGGGMADLFATGTKAISSVGEKALTFQALKLAGGILSVASAWNSFVEDEKQFQKNRAEGNDDLAFLYVTKGMADALSGIISLLSAVSYTEPVFIMIARRFPLTTFGRIAALVPQLGAGVAEGLLIGRALLLCAGIYVGIAILAIQILIWKYSNDALQTWCDRCAFGRKISHRYGNSKIQMHELNHAVLGE